MIVLQYNSVGDGMKWAMKDLYYYARAMASGLEEMGFSPGDSVATRLPDDRPEKHCALFATMLMGMHLVSIDPEMDDGKKVFKILQDHKCRILYYDEPDIDFLDNAIPEFNDYRAFMAKPLVVSGLPKLKYFVTIALDIHYSSHNFPYLMAYDRPFAPVETNGNTIAYVDYNKDGTLRKKYTHAEALKA